MASMNRFSISRIPRIIFGGGTLQQLPAIIKDYGNHTLLVVGKSSFIDSTHWQALQTQLGDLGVTWQMAHITDEPSPALIDSLVAEFADSGITSVAAIGGGSVLDGAKAVAGLLPIKRSVMDYLEGVGPELSYEGPALPLIALPTTAGTGSEATKNAVLSLRQREGFKKSFRDEQLVAEYAIIDPLLMEQLPATWIAQNGMDALTQLIESYVSINANPFTDALALSGIEATKRGLISWYKGDNAGAAEMAYAALLSGITLAQVGLGSVHGLASPLGAFFPIPHGAACGATLVQATKTNIAAMHSRDRNNPALERYATVAQILDESLASSSQDQKLSALITLLTDWANEMKIPSLGEFGVSEADIPHIVMHSRGSSMKSNPILLTDEEIGAIIRLSI